MIMCTIKPARPSSGIPAVHNSARRAGAHAGFFQARFRLISNADKQDLIGYYRRYREPRRCRRNCRRWFCVRAHNFSSAFLGLLEQFRRPCVSRSARPVFDIAKSAPRATPAAITSKPRFRTPSRGNYIPTARDSSSAASRWCNCASCFQLNLKCSLRARFRWLVLRA